MRCSAATSSPRRCARWISRIIALNPGASYRGLHDSLVNHLGNVQPQMLLCLHEENAVAIAHGYAKVTGRPMAAAVHSNVGLMHATMAIFNAWCDRVPVLLLGATGPVDAPKRRPWIDWIHTARDQGALIRDYTKWDDQPASPARRARRCCAPAGSRSTAPMGPVYVNLDAGMQEAPLAEPLPPIDVARFVPPTSRRAVAPEPVAQAVALLRAARAAADPDGPRSRASERLGRPRRAGRALRRPGRHRPEGRRGVPDRPSAACRRAATLPGPDAAQAIAAGRRHPEPRLGRPRRHAELACGTVAPAAKVIQRLARSPAPQRLEHGPSGAAAGRSVHRGRRRRRGRRPADAAASAGAGRTVPRSVAGAATPSAERRNDHASRN